MMHILKFMSMAMKRILGIEEKNRVRVHIMIEQELYDQVKQRNDQISDLVNVLLERELISKK